MFVEIIKYLFPGTYDHIYASGMSYQRRQEQANRDEIARCEKSMWVGSKVIILSNQWADPYVGTVTGTEDFGRGELFLVVKHAITQEEQISFGKPIKFTTENLKLLCSATPSARWNLLTGQAITHQLPSENVLSTYEQMIEKLAAAGFLDS